MLLLQKFRAEFPRTDIAPHTITFFGNFGLETIFFDLHKSFRLKQYKLNVAPSEKIIFTNYIPDVSDKILGVSWLGKRLSGAYWLELFSLYPLFQTIPNSSITNRW